MKNKNIDKGSRNLHKQLSDTEVIMSNTVHLTLIANVQTIVLLH